MDERNFGERMRDLRRERGVTNPGRPRIADKYRRQLEAVEKVFADALPELARQYVTELQVQAPETCPAHHRVLRCPEPECSHQSQRTAFNHKAASYALDRLMGRPTTRSENALTVRFIREMTEQFSSIFLQVNALSDPDERRAVFAARLMQLAEAYDPNAGGW